MSNRFDAQLHPGHGGQIPLPRSVVRRSRAFDLLDAARSSAVTLVCAPAGYGKSLLVASWLIECEVRPASWVRLERSPAVAEHWVRACLALASAVDDGSGEQVVEIGRLAERAPHDVPSRLGRWLRERETPITLVLDDLHLVSDQAMHEQLVELVAASGDGLRLIVLTRHDPP